jgi:hypothetical protein
MTTRDIKHCYTLKSRYDNDSVVVVDFAGNQYRLKMDDLIGLLGDDLPITIRKARVHNYIELDKESYHTGFNHYLKTEGGNNESL